MRELDELDEIAAFATHRYEDCREPAHLLEQVRKRLPTRTRASDERHPANPRNLKRNRSIPDDDIRHIVEVPKWQLVMDEKGLQIRKNDQGTEYQLFSHIPIDQRERIPDILIELGIEVRGTPPHGGRKGSGSGFEGAMRSLIEHEVAKVRARMR